jgi:N utilization substance protein A
VITAIVDEDQLSLAIGRNGQNVRLASQLIGWQLDLYGSREWLERGADAALFGGGAGEEDYEAADFNLSELELPEATVAALESAGYTTFFDIIDLDREDFLSIEGVEEEAADRLVAVIDELTVEETVDEAEAEAAAAADAELEDAKKVAAEMLGMDVAGDEAEESDAAVEEDAAAGEEEDV